MDYKLVIAEEIKRLVGVDNVENMLEIPPNPEMGDYALPCFKLARQMRQPPETIARIIRDKIKQPYFLSALEIDGGYLNFYLDRFVASEAILQTVTASKGKFGMSDEGKGKTIVIDYSSINIAKPFHIGHLSTTAIGNSLYRIYKFLGYNCVGVNHLGDWGTQFGKLIVAYKRWGNKVDIEKNSVRAMLDLYVRFHNEAEQDRALEEEARRWFRKIESGNKEALELFELFKELTLKEVEKVYDMLDVHFDSYAGESFYNDKILPVVDELKQQNLLEMSDGAYVVRMDEEDLPPCIILKSDGTTLYMTRDLAAAIYRKKTYNFHKCLYVVAYQQNLHFRQLFRLLDMMGYEWHKDMEHVSFGMVSLKEGTLSTRKGRVVFLEEVLNMAIEKTRNIIEEKNPELENKDQVAKDVGVGAVVFGALYGGRIEDITFELDRVLNFDGETGPYVQYTHARARSVLKRGIQCEMPDYSKLCSDSAFNVVKQVALFPETVLRAKEKHEPAIITRYVVSLAQVFNKFYYDIRIIDNDAAATAARLELTKVVADILKSGLSLIGLRAPDSM